MNKYVKWALLNGSVLAAFIGGIVLNLPSLTLLIVILLWVSVVMTMVAALSMGIALETKSEELKAKINKLVPTWLSMTSRR